MLAALAAGGAALVLGGGAVAVARRRRGDARETRAIASDAAAERLGKFQADPIGVSAPEVPAAPAVNGATAWIEWEPGEQRQVGDRPVTIGSTGDCDIRVEGLGDRLARLRVWRRDGAYMVHNLSAASAVTINGRSISWAVLEDGDEIEVGGTTLRFRDEAGRT
jgi:hypothetical protein